MSKRLSGFQNSELGARDISKKLQRSPDCIGSPNILCLRVCQNEFPLEVYGKKCGIRKFAYKSLIMEND